jgi:uncharacterized protein
MPRTKEEIIQDLGLQPLPHEGGYFAQIERTQDKISCRLQSNGLEVLRPRLTEILFLVGGADFSAFHSLEFDEVYKFEQGSACELVQISQRGVLSKTELCPERPQVCVPAGVYQGLSSKGEWSLVRATMSPGFEYEDLTVPSRSELLAKFPKLQREVESLSRP